MSDIDNIEKRISELLEEILHDEEKDFDSTNEKVKEYEALVLQKRYDEAFA